MLTIQEIANQIKDSLHKTDDYDLIMDSFIIGVIFERKLNKTSQEFQDVLELISRLRVMIDAQLCEKQAVIEIFNKAAIFNGNIREMYNQLNGEEAVQQVPSLNIFISQQKLPSQQQQQQFSVEKKEQIKEQLLKQEISQNFKSNQQQPFDNDQFSNEPQLKVEDQLSIALARELQKQFEEELSLEEIQRQQQEECLRQQKMKDSYMKNQVECKICLDYIAYDEMSILNCCHIYHLQCLNRFCTTQIQARQFPLLCPVIECREPIIFSDLRAVLDDINLNEFQQFTFKHYIESHGDEYSWCPTPDCKYVFISGENPYFECPICQKMYCLACKIDYHLGQTCQEYKDEVNRERRLRNEQILDDQFLNFVRGSKFKQCPQCKFWVEKNQGCDHMTCRCSFQFCYVCGGVYLRCACVRR